MSLVYVESRQGHSSGSVRGARGFVDLVHFCVLLKLLNIVSGFSQHGKDRRADKRTMQGSARRDTSRERVPLHGLRARLGSNSVVRLQARGLRQLKGNAEVNHLKDGGHFSDALLQTFRGF